MPNYLSNISFSDGSSKHPQLVTFALWKSKTSSSLHSHWSFPSKAHVGQHESGRESPKESRRFIHGKANVWPLTCSAICHWVTKNHHVRMALSGGNSQTIPRRLHFFFTSKSKWWLENATAVASHVDGDVLKSSFLGVLIFHRLIN